jgi:hypothetical protein
MHRGSCPLGAYHLTGLPGLERAPFPGGERALRQLTLVVSE